MARNSEFFLGDSFIDVIKLGDDDIKIYLQDTLIYQPRISIGTATVTCNVATYNGNPQSATTIQVTLSGNQLTLNEDFIVTSNTGGTNVGSYNVTVQGIGLYKGNASGTFTIEKVTPTVVAPVPNVLTYNGTAQELVTPGSTDFGTLKYKVGSSGSYSTSIPTRTRGGAYTVFYKVDGDSNVNDFLEDSVPCSINEKPVTAVVTVSPSSYTYSGSYCEPTVTVKDGETVIDPSEYTVVYSNNLNAGTATVTIYDVVGGDYYVTGSTTFEIAKQTPVLATSPTSTSPTYNGSAQDLLTGGSMKHSSSVSTAVPGTFTYDKGTDAKSYTNPKWYFTPTDTTNYNSTNGTVITTTTISCSSSYTITAPTAKTGLVYNGSSQTLYNAGSSATVSGSFGYTGGTMTNAGSQTVSWAFTPSSANYCSKNGSFTGSIAQKAISIPTPTGVSRAYNGNAATATFPSATGAGITNYRYSTNGSSWTESSSNPNQTNAGTLYTQAYYKANDANYSGEGWSNSATIAISKADQSAPTATGATSTYPTGATATASGGGGQGTLTWTNGSSRSTCGEQNTKAYWAGNSNYNASPESNQVTITVNKGACPSYTAPTAKSVVYNGSSQAIYNAGTSSNGSFSYSNGTRTDVGNQKVDWTFTPTDSCRNGASGSVTGSVTCKSCTAPTAKSLTYTGSNQALVNAGSTSYGTMVYSTDNSNFSTTIPTGNAAGSYTVYWKVTGNTNVCCTASSSVAVTISCKSISIPTPTGVSRAYNGSAATATFPAATGASITKYRYSTNGSSWTETTSNPSQTNAGTLYTQAYYKYSNSNYCGEGWSSSATISIAKANISPSVSISNWVWGETAQSPSVNGNTGGGSVTYTYLYPGTSSYSSTAPTSKSDIGTYTVKASIAATTNYNAATATKTFSILTNFKPSGADAFITSDGKYFEIKS